MTRFLNAAGYAGILIATLATTPAASAAGEPARSVREGQGVVTHLGANASAVTYWSSGPDGWRVVTTVDTTADAHTDRHAIVRFSASLLPGQSQLISVPAAAGEVAPQLRIRRLADRAADGIEVTQVSAASD